VEWLFCIDVTTKEFGAGDNIKLRLGHLEELAKKTKGKPGITIVAQTAVEDVDEKSMSLYKKFVALPYHIDRYIIRDGEIKKIDSVNSKGVATDVQELLSFATSRFEGKRTALIIDSHGLGNRGLSADTGKSTVDDLVKAIKNGLGGKGKLDLLDFDSCLMAQNGVLQRMQEVTGTVVASAETEGALGQDLVGPISKVADNLKMTPHDLAELMVETARQQKLTKKPADREVIEQVPEGFLRMGERGREGSESPTVPIRTLAHFKVAHYNAYKQELDALGDALVEAIKNPRNRHTIDTIIESTPRYGSFARNRDVKKFVESVLDAVADKKLEDPDDQLRIHGGKVLDAMKKLVVSYSGFDRYATRGGLSTYLPEREQVDFRLAATTTADALVREADNPPAVPEKKADYVKWMNEHLDYMRDKQVKPAEEKTAKADLDEVKSALQRARDAVDKFAKADGLKDTLQTLADLRTAAKVVKNTRFFENYKVDEQCRMKKNLLDYYRIQLVSDDNGWGRFREALRRLD
jgi:hypothetical protein